MANKKAPTGHPERGWLQLTSQLMPLSRHQSRALWNA
jgi:hypothetical protein